MIAIHNPDSKTWTRSFTDWSDWLDFATKATSKLTSGLTSRDISDGDWAGTKTFEDAEKLARDGWAAGLERVKPMAESIKSVLCSKIIRPEAQHAESGDEVDIDRYLEGEPEHMIEYPMKEMHATGGRIVSVGLNLFMSGGCDKHIFEMRGAAIIALVDALECAGYRTEVHLCMGANGSRDGNASYQSHAPIKQAGEPAELDRLVFAFSHPAVFRRLWFAHLENDPESDCCTSIGAGRGRGYSSPGSFNRASVPMDFFFERLSAGEDNGVWNSIQSATAEVLRLLKASNLVELEEAA